MRCANNLQKCGLENVAREAAHRAERADASRKLSRAAAFCLFFMLVEVVGGLYANSLAVLTDAAHLLTDIAGFAISLFAIWATSWESTAIQSYGFFRLEILGALVSIQFIWLMTGMLLYEAMCRLVDSGNDAVDGKVMFVVATLGLFVNIIMIAVLGHDGHSHDLGGHEHHEAHDHHAGEEEVDIRNPNGGSRDHHEHHENHGHDDDRTEHATIRTYSEQGEHADHALVCTGKHEHAEHAAHKSKAKGSHDTSSSAKISKAKGSHDTSSSAKTSKAKGSHVTSSSAKTSKAKGSHNTSSSAKTSKAKGSHDTSSSAKTTSSHQRRRSNINVEGAYLHVLGDLIQSIGVMFGGAVIWYNPEWKVIDLICTLLFSVLVLFTTIQMLRDVLSILMESTPREVDAREVKRGLQELPGVVTVHELHIWAITMGKTLLTCHIRVLPDVNHDEILILVTSYLESCYHISHATIQVESDDT